MSYIYWFIIAIVLIVLEIFTPGFVIMWFGVGAIFAGIADLIGINEALWQVLIFSLVSLIMLALSRTIFKSVFVRSPGTLVKTNMDSLIEKVGIVTEQINNDLSQGRISVESQDWLARSENNEIIEAGTKVKILRFEGIKLFVERV